MALRWLIGCVVAAAAVTAHAQTAALPPALRPLSPPGETPPRSVPPVADDDEEDLEYGHYGLEIVPADVAALVLVRTGDSVAKIGLGLYLLDGPIVHALHGQGGRAAGSFALRVGMPFAIGFAFHSLAGGDSEGDGILTLLGVVLGAMGAAAIDDAAVARSVPRRPSAKRAGATWSPHIAVSQRLTSLGVAGRF